MNKTRLEFEKYIRESRTITQEQLDAMRRIMRFFSLGNIDRRKGSNAIKAYIKGEDRHELFAHDVETLGGTITSTRSLGNDLHATNAYIPDLLDHLMAFNAFCGLRAMRPNTHDERDYADQG